MAALKEWAEWARRAWRRLIRVLAGAPAFPPPVNPALLAQTQGWFGEQLHRHAHIPMGRRAEYARSAGVIFARMTPTALLRLRRNTREVRFYASLEEMTVELARTGPTVARMLAQGLPIGGAYQGASRRLHLDGGREAPPQRNIVELYAHEFCHALNGPERSISESAPWQDSWRAELVPRALSTLAASNPHEGFAEFGAFMYAGVVTRRFLARRYPRCVEVWEGHGLW